LRDVGYQRIVNLAGGTEAWMRAGLPTEKAPRAA
jgi:rhodanese-related sulfurtransferase